MPMKRGQPTLPLPSNPLPLPVMKGTRLHEKDYQKLRFPLYGSIKYDGVRVVFYDGAARTTANKLHRNPRLQAFAATRVLEGYEAEFCLRDAKLAAESAGYLNQVNPEPATCDLFVFGKYGDHLFNGAVPSVAAVKKHLIEHIGPKSEAHHVKHSQLRDVEELEHLVASTRDFGYEGLMLRGGDLRYHHSRATLTTQRCLKIKFTHEFEAECVGWAPLERNLNDPEDDGFGRQTRSSSQTGKEADFNLTGALWMRSPLFKDVIHVGSGFTMAQRREYAHVNVVGRTAEIEYQKHGSTEDLPRQPIFKRWKGDL